MFKCTGMCSACGKCRGELLAASTSRKKAKMIAYPGDFVPEKREAGYGIAFDIGTTTVVGILRDLSTGEQIGAAARTNPQNKYGMDVISRITFCGADGENLDILRDEVLSALNEIIGELCAENSIDSHKIISAVLCGNTTMSHIFAGYPPMSLARSPFTPAYTGPVNMSGNESGLRIDPNAEVTALPGIAGHVGGDITSGILAARVLSANELTLFIDIGTNGEIVMTDGKKSYACSTAAGPAFEGAAISFGMRASEGAIEKVKIEGGEVYFKTIGSCEPVGICGSGLIDLVAEMVKSGLIEPSGRLISREKAADKNIDPGLADRLTESDGKRQFIVVSKVSGDDIILTQNDIREVQLAKGAIAAGIEIMLSVMDVNKTDICRIIVAGAFGNYIDGESAIMMGLLPNMALERITYAGNAAGTGVSMALASEKEMLRAESIPPDIEHVELATNKDFQSIYMAAMSFLAV